MMWIAIAVLTGLATLSVLVPLTRRKEAAVAGAERAFYDAQIAEIERDLARGILSPEDAGGARAEAARRLIACHDAEGQAVAPSTMARRAAAVLAIILVPAIGIGLYSRLGNPDLPDRPLAERLNATPGAGDIFAAIARIEKHLATAPDDARGWEIIAPVYLKTGRPLDAARAWSQVIRISGPTPERYTSVGEALIFAGEGKVSPEALAAFEKALELDPKFAQARFYTGLAAEQAGDRERARDIWSRLLADAPADAPWATPVRARIAALGPQIKVPPPDELAARAVTALPREEQQAAIRTMVERLALRLKDNGNDGEGWLMLVNAYNVLKDSEKARKALGDARKALAGNADALEKLNMLARQLGIEG